MLLLFLLQEVFMIEASTDVSPELYTFASLSGDFYLSMRPEFISESKESKIKT